MELETKRCIIRQFNEKDLDSFIEYRNDLAWMQYQEFKGLSRSAYAEQLLKALVLDNGIQLAVSQKATGSLIGDIYLHKENSILWLGYTIHPQYARLGYAYEVTQAVIAWADMMNYTSVKAGVLTENTASIQLLKKLGFTFFSLGVDGEEIYRLAV